MLNLDEKQLKALHTRANLRRFLECVNGSHVEKIAKMCAKGLDPNFHCPETGDTPLTLATGTKKPNKLLIALVNGGALLDYRNRLVLEDRTSFSKNYFPFLWSSVHIVH